MKAFARHSLIYFDTLAMHWSMNIVAHKCQNKLKVTLK